MEKVTPKDQQMNKSSKKTLTEYLERKMKTVLAPNAPWPKPEVTRPRGRQVGWRKVKIDCENADLDYFAKTHEELNQYKIASKHRVRDNTTGRFKSNERLAG